MKGKTSRRCSLVSLYWRESLSESLARIKLGAGEDGIDADELGSIELRGRGLGEGQAGGTNPLYHPSAPRTASTPSRQKQRVAPMNDDTEGGRSLCQDS